MEATTKGEPQSLNRGYLHRNPLGLLRRWQRLWRNDLLEIPLKILRHKPQAASHRPLQEQKTVARSEEAVRPDVPVGAGNTRLEVLSDAS